MAIASTRTRLPLDRFFRLARIHPLHGNQVTVEGIQDTTVCDEPMLQYAWQHYDRTGREEVAETIADVEARLEKYLNFALVPSYYTNWSRPYPQPAQPELFSTSQYDIRGMARAMKLGVGYVVSGGAEAKTLITASAPVVYSDVDSDGYFETATITVSLVGVGVGTSAPTVAASELAIYYPGNGGDSTFEIRPVSVSIVGNVATIMCMRAQLVRPELLFGMVTNTVDGLDDTRFLATVDVYRHWLDPSQQVEFRYEQVPWTLGSPAVQFSVGAGAMMVHDAKLGWAGLETATWDSTNLVWNATCSPVLRNPDTVRLWFKAGWPLDAQGNMDGVWERAVTYMTLAQIDRPLCGCDALKTYTEYWSKDMAMNTAESSRQVGQRLLNNPLGTTRAAIYAWEQVSRYALPG